MVTHQMNLSSIPFEKIISGKKIIESRLYDEKRKKINPGDRIEFTCSNDPKKQVMAEVQALYRYDNFEHLFSDFPPSYFGGPSKKFLVKEIEGFYSKEEQQKTGVIGIKIKKSKI